MQREQCYIDRYPCTGARFSFCKECMKAQQEKEDAIRRARTPFEVTRAHIPKKEDK